MNRQTQSPAKAQEGHDNNTTSNRNTKPAQGESGRREDQDRKSVSRTSGPGFGKGSNAV